MRKIVSVVSVLVVVLVSAVAFAQEVAPANGTAAVMCGLLEVPSGCTCKDTTSNTLDCAAGAEVAVPVGGGKMVVEDGGKTTIYVPAQPIAKPEAVVQPETKDAGWAWWEYALVGVGAGALGVGAYYAVDAMTTTEVHIRDK